ncbi:hypothetical protein [Acetobacter sp. DsW_063]|uniref:hypothetical protein n=1 Tax=Acetobacter sp. DsW_063 TaxID=1514894 RepID=UPI000A3ACF16|nr:hypothetical protein [Acetobacter sp. DsW_063]OUJ17079.1 hypothetical protein HK28_07880 [Acetobacter sp. DsW_063]
MSGEDAGFGPSGRSPVTFGDVRGLALLEARMVCIEILMLKKLDHDRAGAQAAEQCGEMIMELMK